MVPPIARIDASGTGFFGDQLTAIVVGMVFEQDFQNFLTYLPREINECAESFAAFVVNSSCRGEPLNHRFKSAVFCYTCSLSHETY